MLGAEYRPQEVRNGPLKKDATIVRRNIAVSFVDRHSVERAFIDGFHEPVLVRDVEIIAESTSGPCWLG